MSRTVLPVTGQAGDGCPKCRLRERIGPVRHGITGVLLDVELSIVEREYRAAGVMTSPETPPPGNLAQWLACLQSPSASLADRIEAANRLADAPEHPQSMQTLLDTLQSETEPRLLMHLINLMARKKLYAAVMPLIDLVLCAGDLAVLRQNPTFSQSDAGIRIRTTAIQALGRMGDERALVPLMSIMGNQKDNYRLRLAAAESLGRLGDSQALNPLINIVNDDQESSQFLKESAVKALGMLGDIRALEPLLDMFESRKGFRNKFNFLKEQIVEAIGRLGSNHNRALQALLDATQDENAIIRLSAVESLAEVGDTSCIAPLRELLTDPDDDVAIAAAAALYQLGGEALVRDILADGENLPQFIRQELESYVP